MPKGDCFVAALRTARFLHSQGHRVLLCHGRPLGLGGNAQGLRYWHAWAEVKIGNEWIVADDSNNRSVWLRRVTYYRIGSIPAPGDHVRRFSMDDAERMLFDREHYGPWVAPEEMDEWQEASS